MTWQNPVLGIEASRWLQEQLAGLFFGVKDGVPGELVDSKEILGRCDKGCIKPATTH